jgi:hypothetical protein
MNAYAKIFAVQDFTHLFSHTTSFVFHMNNNVSATTSKRKNSLNKRISLKCDSEMLWGNNYIILVNNFPNEKLGGQN